MEHGAARGDADPGLGEIAALLVVADEPSPAHHPAKGSPDHPSARERMKALLVLQLAHALDDTVTLRRLSSAGPGHGSLSQERRQPRPALAHGSNNLLSPLRIPHIGCGEGHHQEPPICVHGPMALSALHPLRGIITAPARSCGGLPALAIAHPGTRARLPARMRAIKREHHIVNGPKQKPANETLEPPIDGLRTSRMSAPRLRPRRAGLGSKGPIRFHSSSLRSLG